LVVAAAACVPLAPPPAAPVYTPPPPVYGHDFPDPTIVNAGAGGYLAFSTNSIYPYADAPLVPTAQSSCPAGFVCASTTDLGTWTRGNPTDALARPPAWQMDPYHPLRLQNWAPAVHEFGGTWVLYFTAPDPSGDECIGAATSSAPQGPYAPVDAGPIQCDFGAGGSIDPSVVVDDNGTPWLLWKTDGNCCQLPVYIRSRQLAPDGLSFAPGSSAQILIGMDQAWEDGSAGGQQPWKKGVEGPAMVRASDAYWLFYAGNWWDSGAYGIGYARCTSPAGPCAKPHRGPLIGSGAQGAGPGGADTFVDQSGQTWIVYHAWDPSAVGSAANGTRTMRLSRLDLSQGTPVLGAGP
jgi:beta-xylosidase